MASEAIDLFIDVSQYSDTMTCSTVVTQVILA